VAKRGRHQLQKRHVRPPHRRDRRRARPAWRHQPPDFWQTDTAIGNKSWCYIKDEEYKTAGALIGALADIVSKNGTLLLNFGPKPDGTITKADRDVLLGIGGWLKINGEAIYGTRPWKVFGEGPTDVPEGHFTDTTRKPFTAADIRFTTARAECSVCDHPG